MLDDPSFPGRAHFIAHAVRDIADRLVYVLDPQGKLRVQYDSELDWIEAHWPNIQKIDTANNCAANTEAIAIDYEVAIRIDGLVNEQ